MTYYMPNQWQPFVLTPAPPPLHMGTGIPEKWKSHLTVHLPHPSVHTHATKTTKKTKSATTTTTTTTAEPSSATSKDAEAPDVAASASGGGAPSSETTTPPQQQTPKKSTTKRPKPPTRHSSYLPFDTHQLTQYISHPTATILNPFQTIAKNHHHSHFHGHHHHAANATLVTSPHHHRQIYHHKHAWNEGTAACPIAPDTDVHETESFYLLELDIPGVRDKKDISIQWASTSGSGSGSGSEGQAVLVISGTRPALSIEPPAGAVLIHTGHHHNRSQPKPEREDDDEEENELVRVESHSEDGGAVSQASTVQANEVKAKKGKKAKEEEGEEEAAGPKFLLCERRTGSWERHFTFPESVTVVKDGVLAEFNGDGCLRVWVGKVPTSPPSSTEEEEDEDEGEGGGVHEGVTWV